MQEKIALVHEAQGSYMAALQLEKEAIEIRIKKLGPKHPQTVKAQKIGERLQQAA